MREDYILDDCIDLLRSAQRHYTGEFERYGNVSRIHGPINDCVVQAPQPTHYNFSTHTIQTALRVHGSIQPRLVLE
jgi:hypothetical protein